MNQPIICTGNDLAQVCADLRQRGGVGDRIETGVGGKNAVYRVSYLERVSVQVRTDDVAAMATVASSGKREAAALDNFVGGVAEKAGAGSSRTPLRQLTACASETLAAPTNFAGEMGSTPIGCVKQREARGVHPSQTVAAPVVAGEHAGNSFPHQCETPASLLATVAVKGAVAPRNQLNDPKSPCYGSALEQKCPATIRRNPVAAGGAETAGVESFERVASGKDDGTGSARIPVRQLTASGGENPPSLTNLAGNKNGDDVKGAPVPSALAIQHSRKLDSLPSNPSTSQPSQGAFTQEKQLVGGEVDRPDCTETAHPGSRDDISIETRLAALQSRLASSGKLRRSKPSSKEARLPHAND